MYGGEVISMAGENDDEVKSLLNAIGSPLEIVCSIPSDDPHFVDIGNGECYLSRDVLPSEIVGMT
jgi:hypothetical protein